MNLKILEKVKLINYSKNKKLYKSIMLSVSYNYSWDTNKIKKIWVTLNINCNLIINILL